MKRFRFLEPSLPDRGLFARHVDEIYQSRRISNNGPKVRLLERLLAERVQAAHAVCVASGTTGLFIALRAVGLPAGSLVALPAFNFPAAADAILWNQLRLALCDVSPCDLAMIPPLADAATSGARALLPVHTFGNLAAVDAFSAFTRQTGVPVIYDGASALGSLIHTPEATSAGMATVVSLHATKLLTAAEGGVIFTQDAGFADSCRRLSNFGMGLSRVPTEVGLNGKMCELHAAFALAGLETLAEELIIRRELADAYSSALSKATWLDTHLQPGAVPHLFPVTLSVRYPASAREALRRRWANVGVETRCYYDPPLHRALAFRPAAPVDLPVSEALSARVICLPFHPSLRCRDVEDIVGRIVDAGVPDEQTAPPPERSADG